MSKCYARQQIVLNLLTFYLVLCSTVHANVCSNKLADKSDSNDNRESDNSDSSETVECQCATDDNGDTSVDCSSNGYSELPDHSYPLDTSTINFRNNQISHVPTYAFPHVPNLDQINLSLNDITRIDPNAFRSLMNLRYLRLGDNNFSRIDSHTFADLIGLKELHLAKAGVERLAYDAFYFMPELRLLELVGNNLVCDCDTKKLMDWINQSDALITWPTCSNLDDIPLIEIPDTFFENCTHPPPQSCIGCTADSVDSCLKQGKLSTCPITDDSCQLTIDVISGQQTVMSRCRNSTECIEEMTTNGRTCRDGKQEQHCTFCCTGFGCTYKLSLNGYKYRTTMNIQFEMGIEYMEEYSRNSSKEYTELALQVNSQIDSILNHIEGFTLSAPLFRRTPAMNMTYCGLESTSVWLMESTLEYIRQSLYDDLDKAIDLGDLDLNITEDSLIVAIPDYCPPEVELTEKGDFHWPSTRAQTTAAIPCPYPNEANGHATRHCFSVAMTAKDFVVWDDSDLSECAVPSDVTKQLKDLLSVEVTNESVAMITDQLYELTTNTLTSTDLEYTSQLLENVVSANIRMNQLSADNTVATYDNIIATSGSILTESQRNFGAVKRSMLALDLLSGSLLAAPPDGTLTKQRITVGVLRPTPNITEGVVFHIDSSNSDDFNEGDVILSVNQSTIDPWSTDASLAIPGSVLNIIGQKNPNLQFVGFSDDKIFQALDVDYNTYVGSGPEWDLVLSDDSSSVDTVVGNTSNGRIMAATFGGVHFTDLPEPVTITFRHKEKDASAPMCVYWDFNATSSGGGAWSSQGCRVVSNVDKEYTICECDHLTNFALLMDIYGTAANISDANAMALSVISYVGCSVSLVCLLLTMITYISFSKLHKDNPSKLLMNLCSALIMVMVLFILVTAPAVREHANTCKAMAGLLHYFLLAAWVWMAVEAFYMYLTLIKIFNTYIRKFLLKCSLVGWGVPALIVIITVSVDTNNYGLQGDICWLGRNAFYGACMAPIFLIMAGNFVVFGLVIHQIRKLSDRSAQRSAKHHGVRTQLRGAFAVVVLLGLTWIFSLFAIGGAGIAFHYLFAIFNSFQGLFIFIFYCVLKKDVKETWREKWSDITSSTTSSSDRGTGKGSSSQTATHSHDRPPPSPVPTTSTGTLETRASRSKPLKGDGYVSGSSECLNEQSFINIQNNVEEYNTIT